MSHFPRAKVLSYRSIVKSTRLGLGMGRGYHHGQYRLVSSAIQPRHRRHNAKLKSQSGYARRKGRHLRRSFDLAMTVIWISDRGSIGAKIFDWVLKIMVGLIVIAFFGVVVKMAGTGELVGKVAKASSPISLISEPAERLPFPISRNPESSDPFGKTRSSAPKRERHGCRRRYCRRY